MYYTIATVAMFLWIELLAIIVTSTVFDTSIAISRENVLANEELYNFENVLANEEQYNFENISVAFNNFASPLYKSLLSFTSSATGMNIIISPLSVYIILSLLSYRAEGSTLNELKSVLNFDDEKSFHYELQNLLTLFLSDFKKRELHIRNIAYIDREIELMGPILRISWNNFISMILKIDFRNKIHAATLINSLLQEDTNTIFDEILPEHIDDSTKFVLVNTVYFKSSWLYIFDEKDTKRYIFHVSKTKKYFVPTMLQKSIYEYGKIGSWRCKFIEIPYLNKDIVMIILLPNREITLKTLENNFNWQTLINTESFSDLILLHLPKFQFEVTIDLENVLRKIGLNMMFEDQANFTRFSKSPLKVNRVLQKVIVEVNEKGSEFPAAKVVNGKQWKWNVQFGLKRFIVNRPFMFAIAHKPTRIPLFLGSVRIPNISSQISSRLVRGRNNDEL